MFTVCPVTTKIETVSYYRHMTISFLLTISAKELLPPTTMVTRKRYHIRLLTKREHRKRPLFMRPSLPDGGWEIRKSAVLFFSATGIGKTSDDLLLRRKRDETCSMQQNTSFFFQHHGNRKKRGRIAENPTHLLRACVGTHRPPKNDARRTYVRPWSFSAIGKAVLFTVISYFS